ncbi:unnamed protein product [Medioppia subpectinata]|uniref:NR LBD domain-containing protein n=1 Tax=Medioppia subpectinata TaxID=1979941 RepID=A0A7R9KGM8_9ACAR|nr:unnamed protein product [Medioppia subpectinata]CAG2103010.1 unnamed protein product [Medioppia subpectinata]
MATELIRSNDENQLRRLQLLERKQRVKVLPQITDSSGSDTTDNSVSAEDTNELDVMFDLIQNTPEINDKDLNKQIAEIESILTTNSALIDKYCHKMQTLTVVPIFKSLTDYNGLNQLETIRVSELLMACKVLDYPMPTNAIKVSDKEEIIRLSNRKSESMVADVITFAKRLTRFSDLCFADQLALIKYGSLELLIMCYTKFYNIEHDQFVVYLDETNSLMVIILFNPNRPNLIHKDCVQLEQQLLKMELRNRSFPVPIANRFLCLHALPLECATARSTATLYIPIATDYYRNQCWKEISSITWWRRFNAISQCTKSVDPKYYKIYYTTVITTDNMAEAH